MEKDLDNVLVKIFKDIYKSEVYLNCFPNEIIGKVLEIGENPYSLVLKVLDLPNIVTVSGEKLSIEELRNVSIDNDLASGKYKVTKKHSLIAKFYKGDMLVMIRSSAVELPDFKDKEEFEDYLRSLFYLSKEKHLELMNPEVNVGGF